MAAGGIIAGLDPSGKAVPVAVSPTGELLSGGSDGSGSTVEELLTEQNSLLRRMLFGLELFLTNEKLIDGELPDPDEA